MNTKTLTVSVIVCCYTLERWNELTHALAALRAQKCSPCEIIVVVDHNAQLLDKTRKTFPEVKVMANRHARGLSGTRNSGIENATGDIIAFVDEDAVADRDWLARVMDQYADARVMGGGGGIFPQWRGQAQELTARPRWFPPEMDWVVGCTYRGMPEQRAEVRNLIGCNMSFRREVFEWIGGFREGIGRLGALPLGCEETELCIRLRQAIPEARVVYEPCALVLHAIPASRATVRYFCARCFAEGVSKAQISAFVGAGDALADERAHVRHILTGAVAQNLIEGAREGDAACWLRAGALVLGVACAAAGYCKGHLDLHRAGFSAPTSLPPRLAAPSVLE